MTERGASTVEFALVLPVVVLVLLAAVEVVVVARARIELVAAAREGARVAATTPDPSQAASAARAALDPELAGRARISVRRPAVVGALAEVTVSVAHRLPLAGVTVDLRSRSAMRVER